MRAFILISVVVCFMLTSFVIPYAELYKWTDENGQVHYQDYPPDNTLSAGKVEKVKAGSNFTIMGSPPPEIPTPGQYTTQRNVPQKAVRKEYSVELYVTSWCPYCKLAKNFFLSKGIPFKEYDIEKDTSAAQRKRELDSRGGVPFAVINGVRIHGYSEQAYNQALNKR